jgi:hypothetical protein
MIKKEFTVSVSIAKPQDRADGNWAILYQARIKSGEIDLGVSTENVLELGDLIASVIINSSLVGAVEA